MDQKVSDEDKWTRKDFGRRAYYIEDSENFKDRRPISPISAIRPGQPMLVVLMRCR